MSGSFWKLNKTETHIKFSSLYLTFNKGKRYLPYQVIKRSDAKWEINTGARLLVPHSSSCLMTPQYLQVLLHSEQATSGFRCKLP
jgi:hypothetical protein